MKGKDLLFVHGAWHGAWCWDHYFVPYFTEQGYTCHNFNLPKHGEPGKTQGINKFSLQDYVNALKNEVKKLSTDPIIVAHSMGGIVLQKYLETEKCEMAILLGSIPAKGAMGAALQFMTKGYSYPGLLGFDLYKLVNSKKKAKWAFFSEHISDQELEEHSKKLGSESYKAFMQLLLPRVKTKFHQQVPMLVIGSNGDRFVSVKESEAMAKKYHADFEIAGDIGHCMMLDNGKEKVATMIDSWITAQYH